MQEDETLKAQVELLRQCAEIVRLRFPIDAPRDEMTDLERHFRISLERFKHIGLVVLAGDGEQHAGVALSQHELLYWPRGPSGNVPEGPISPPPAFHHGFAAACP